MKRIEGVSIDTRPVAVFSTYRRRQHAVLGRRPPPGGPRPHRGLRSSV